MHSENGHCARKFITPKKNEGNKGLALCTDKKNHILWVMCSNSYTAEALVPASALTAKKKKNIEKKPKVYRSSKLWSKHTAGKVDVSLLGEGIAEINEFLLFLFTLP